MPLEVVYLFLTGGIMMNEIVEQEKIEGIIYEIRGVQVMLDSDLANLYQVETKRVNEAVKNNQEKFPERYCFRLNDEECYNLRSKFLSANINEKSRSNPRVFTEQGVYMLATVLKGKKASIVTLQIMDAFVLMKKYISHDIMSNRLFINHEERILKLEESFDKFSSKQNTIIYDGKIYDAYSTLLDIFNDSKKEVIIVDNYANKELFDILRNIDRKIIVISKNLDDVLMKKYNNQYSNIIFINNDFFHDRYIILDRTEVYVSGMSLKDVGKKYSYIYKMNEKMFIDELIKKIEDIVEL